MSGTPTQGGSFSIIVKATDANGCSGTSATYTLTIPGGQLTVLAPDYKPQGFPLTYTMLGLPQGLSFSGTTISGTSTKAGRKAVTVIAVDASGQTANTSFSLAVNPPNPPAPSADLFQLLAPVYNCAGDWITFQTIGAMIVRSISSLKASLTGPVWPPR